MRKLWIVTGHTGEYSDRSSWLVAAYADEAAAKEHVVAASRRARELSVWHSENDEEWRYTDEDKRPANEWDPGYRSDYTGTTYELDEVTLIDGPLDWQAHLAALAMERRRP